MSVNYRSLLFSFCRSKHRERTTNQQSLSWMVRIIRWEIRCDLPSVRSEYQSGENENPLLIHIFPSFFSFYVNDVTSTLVCPSLRPALHPSIIAPGRLHTTERRRCVARKNGFKNKFGQQKYVTRSKNVKFCAYSIPHPNDKKVLLQVQVYPGRGSAVDALEQGLRDLHDVSRHIKSVLKVSSNKKRSRSFCDRMRVLCVCLSVALSAIH